MSARTSRARVLIAGCGVAGLETLLALRALTDDQLDITVVAPELKFFNQAISVDEPFKPKRGRGLRLDKALAELGARRVRAQLDCVKHEQRLACTRDGERLAYDRLVLALGARPEQWVSRSLFDRGGAQTLSYCGGRDSPDYRLLLHRVHEGRVNRLAFLKPAGPSWPLPLYDLALLTAADCAAHGRSDVELSLVTPEEEPLGLFGPLRSDISGGAGDDSTISGRALWWPPNKLAGRYLGPYLSSQVGEAVDVMPKDSSGIPVETRLDPSGPDHGRLLHDLSEANTS